MPMIESHVADNSHLLSIEKCTIRPANANDRHLLAWAMQCAARSHLPKGLWDFVFPQSEEDRLRHLAELSCAGEDHFCHYRRFFIIEAQGQACATACGFDPELHGLEVMVPILIDYLKKQGWSQSELFSLIVQFGPYKQCGPNLRNGTYILEWVATLPKFRGNNLMPKLLRHMLQNANRIGYNESQVAILIGNEPARRSYEKLGFCYADEKRSEGFYSQYKSRGMARYVLNDLNVFADS